MRKNEKREEKEREKRRKRTRKEKAKRDIENINTQTGKQPLTGGQTDKQKSMTILW